MSRCAIFRQLGRERRGTVTIETAIVAPVLVLMSLGTFDVSTMVSRQNELQSAAAEAAAIARAAPPATQEQRNTMRDVIKVSTGIASNDKVVVSEIYRCDTNASYTTNKSACGEGASVATFIKVVIDDRYVPSWTQFGVGKPVDYHVERTVQIS